MKKATSRALPKTAQPDIRACCGFHCSSCPSYKENAKTKSDRTRVSEGWQKLYGLAIPQEALCCDGCLEPDENHPHRIGGACPIRTCVLEKKIAHCGECSSFPCEGMEKHFQSVESVIPKAQKILTPIEYRDFVEPYLAREFLTGQAEK